MRLIWDAAPGAVRKYRLTYKAEEGDVKEVSFQFCLALTFSEINVTSCCLFEPLFLMMMNLYYHFSLIPLYISVEAT